MDHQLIGFAPWGKWYIIPRIMGPLGSYHSHEQLVFDGAKEFDGEDRRVSNVERWKVEIKYHGCPAFPWKTGFLWHQKRVIDKTDTDQPLMEVR